MEIRRRQKHEVFQKISGGNDLFIPKNTEDVEIFTEWLNDFETTDYLGRSGYLVSFEAEKKYLEQNADNQNVNFVMVTLENDKMIGTVSLEQIDNINRTATLGIFIGDKEYRSRGIGTEAIKLILDYGFHYLNLQNIKLDLMAFNERALRCYQKCGFKEYGRRRKCKFVNGKFYDSIQMDILAEEFSESYIKNKNI